MKALAISGGSTKISFLSGAAIELMRLNNYDIITGISAGAITSLMLAIEDYDVLKDSICTATQDDFFDVLPTTDEGKLTLRGILRAITGKESLGKFTLLKLLKKYYTIDKHTLLQNSGKIVKVGATNLNFIKMEYCDITKVDYDTALRWVVASASIPIATETIKIGSCYYVDGGVLEHVPAMEALRSGATSLDIIFSRPINGFELNSEDIEWKPKNIFEVAIRTLNVTSTHNTIRDEDEIKLACSEYNIPLSIYYAPFALTHSLYKMDVDLSRAWFELGRNLILDCSTTNEFHDDNN